jgi:hypothetical protein
MRRSRTSVALTAAVVASSALLVHASAASAKGSKPQREPAPVVRGPVHGGTHGRAFNEWPWPLRQYGYKQAEYYVSSTAKAYGSSAGPARYKTRIQVFRPIDPRRFSGTAIVEWSNVTAQYDIPLGWVWTHPYVMRQGDVVVTVSAQEVGVCGNKSPAPGTEVCSPTSLKGWDSQRYGSLHHPGDDYSFDIFSQAVRALRARPRGVDPVAGLRVRHVIGYGQSQSAMRLGSYLCNGADRGARVLDAVLIDADLGAALSCRPRVPTIQLWSEESAKPVETTTGQNHRIWMLPGAPHEDRWQAAYEQKWTNYNNLGQKPDPPDNASMQASAGDYGQPPTPSATAPPSCLPDGDAVPRRYSVDAAVHALREWVLRGTPAPTVRSIEFASGPPPTPFTTAASFQRDENLNTLGGVRSPVLDVPVATYQGTTCGLFGVTIPFTPAQLALRYPSHASYVDKMHASVEDQVRKGLLLPLDATDLMARACASTVGGQATPAGGCPPVTARSPYRDLRSRRAR